MLGLLEIQSTDHEEEVGLEEEQRSPNTVVDWFHQQYCISWNHGNWMIEPYGEQQSGSVSNYPLKHSY